MLDFFDRIDSHGDGIRTVLYTLIAIPALALLAGAVVLLMAGTAWLIDEVFG